MIMEINTIRGLRNLKRKKEYSSLSEIEQRVRKSLINYVVNNSIPFNINLDSVDLLNIDNISEFSIKEIIKGLVAKRILSMDQEGDINFLYPVSALPTNHIVTLGDGRSFNSMCGIDALGSTMTFNQDVHIESVCSHCGERIVIDVKNRNLEYLSSEEIHVIHMEASENEDWAVNC
ncbi:hypothetical protein E9840_06280 [Tissierella creatinini]|nr:hypothetical protein E9840_06280 [Tissierella creatinini]TJX63745.1 hypothetical protein E8P77_14345 [Soehngenia saccharolytica]